MYTQVLLSKMVFELNLKFPKHLCLSDTCFLVECCMCMQALCFCLFYACYIYSSSISIAMVEITFDKWYNSTACS